MTTESKCSKWGQSFLISLVVTLLSAGAVYGTILLKVQMNEERSIENERKIQTSATVLAEIRTDVKWLVKITEKKIK